MLLLLDTFIKCYLQGGFISYHATAKPYLEPGDPKRRLLFAHRWLAMSLESKINTAFSDESYFALEFNLNRQIHRRFCPAGQKPLHLVKSNRTHPPKVQKLAISFLNRNGRIFFIIMTLTNAFSLKLPVQTDKYRIT